MARALFIACLLCAWSARPVDFHVAGYEPRLFAKCAGDVVWMKRYASEDMQMRIDENRTCLVRSAVVLVWGAAVAAAAPVTGIFANWLSGFQ